MRGEQHLSQDIRREFGERYWVKAGSLLHSDTRGNDLPDPDTVRFYLISGLSHGVGNVTSKAMCQQFLNPTSPFPALRALLNALDQWVTDGIAPPQSQVPRRADHSAVLAVARPGYQTGLVPQDALGWPSIPGVTYKGWITTQYTWISDRGSIRGSCRTSAVARAACVSDLRVKGRSGRQRGRWYPLAASRSTGRHHHRLGAAPF